MICPHCETEFVPKKSTQVYCCRRCKKGASEKRRYQRRGRRPDQIVSDARTHKRRKQRNKDFVYIHKLERGCSRCPERRPSCLDYHHIDPTTKKGEISRLAKDTRSFQTLVDEMAKCILLCANCHRVEESGDGYRPKDRPLASITNPPEMETQEAPQCQASSLPLSQNS